MASPFYWPVLVPCALRAPAPVNLGVSRHMALLTFAEAIADAQSHSKRHLLLGNGFSIALRPNIFQYGKLYEQADFSIIFRWGSVRHRQPTVLLQLLHNLLM